MRLDFLVVSTTFMIVSFLSITVSGNVDYYVDITAPMGGTGSAAAPFNTLDAAFGAMSSPLSGALTTLHIVSGGDYPSVGYTFSVPVGFSGNITIQGTTLGRARLICTGAAGMFVLTASTPTAASFVVSNVDIVNCQSAIKLSYLKTATLQDVRVINCNSTANGVAYFTAVQSTAIIDSVFQDISGDSGLGAQGAVSINGLDVAFHDNQIINTKFFNIHDLQGPLFVGDDLTFSGATEIAYCTASSSQILINIQNNLYGSSQIVNFDSVYVHDNTANNIIHTSGNPYQLVDVYVGGGTSVVQNTCNGFVLSSNSAQATLVLEPNAYISQNSVDAFQCTGGAILGPDGSSLCTVFCSGGQKLDRCYVCGGNSSCVGCDNLPFSNATCTIAAPVTEISTNETVCIWPDGSPNPVVFPGASTSSSSITITCGLLKEVTSSGAVVAYKDLTNLPWVISTPPNTNFIRRHEYFSTDGKNFSITIDEELFYVATTETSGVVTFTVDKNRLKFSFDIKNWAWINTANSLVIELTIASTDSALSQSSSVQNLNGFDMTTLDIATPNTDITLRFQEFAVLDSVTTAIQVTQVSSSSNSWGYEFKMPHFTQASYDPDFGVVLASNSGGGDGSSDNTGLIVGLVVGLSVFALLVVVIVIGIAAFLTWWKVNSHNRRTKLRSSSMVNFENEEGGDSSD